MITQDLYAKLEAVHGQGRILVVVADELEFALLKISGVKEGDLPSEWENFLRFREANDGSAAESMLRRAVVGLDEEGTKAEKGRLAQVIQEDPQLGDFWGLQLLSAAGFQAPVRIEKSDGTYLLTATVEDVEISTRLTRLTRTQWHEVRRKMATAKQEEVDLLAFELAGGDPGAYPLRPALPYLFGHLAQGLGTKAGSPPKKFTTG